MAPLRPGTVARGANGMMDSGTANGDDRDPEIELFVKVGRHPRPSLGAGSGEISSVRAQIPLGLETLPRERSLAPLWFCRWPFCKGLLGEWSELPPDSRLSSWKVDPQSLKHCSAGHYRGS